MFKMFDSRYNLSLFLRNLNDTYVQNIKKTVLIEKNTTAAMSFVGLIISIIILRILTKKAERPIPTIKDVVNYGFGPATAYKVTYSRATDAPKTPEIRTIK